MRPDEEREIKVAIRGRKYAGGGTSIVILTNHVTCVRVGWKLVPTEEPQYGLANANGGVYLVRMQGNNDCMTWLSAESGGAFAVKLSCQTVKKIVR